MFVRRVQALPVTTVCDYGEVRCNAFRQTYAAGFNLVTGGYPLMQSPNAPAAGRNYGVNSGFEGGFDLGSSDQIQTWRFDGAAGNAGFNTWFLLDLGAGSGYQHWTNAASGDFSSSDTSAIFQPCRGSFLRVRSAKASHLIQKPFGF